MSQDFRRELVGAREAVLDVPRPPQHLQEPQDCIIDPYRASVRGLAFAGSIGQTRTDIVTSVWLLSDGIGCKFAVAFARRST